MKMKKIITFILLALLSVGLVACGNTPKYAVDDYVWAMVTIQSVEENGDFIAYAPFDDTFQKDTYPNAVALDMTCDAKQGLFSVSDKTNNQTYEGTYKLTDNSSKTTIYEVVIGEKSGNAVISTTNYQDGTKTPTMILSIGNYVLNFQAKQCL